ncbi:hypothetical protein GQ600_22394 [Phytophthora cactorum]|nr:hypothetical protein GQ600_22394 [Phytophthora cactorum]
MYMIGYKTWVQLLSALFSDSVLIVHNGPRKRHALPDSYSVDNERLGAAIAHVSAQTNRLAVVHAVLTDRETQQEFRQMQFVEERDPSIVSKRKLESRSLYAPLTKYMMTLVNSSLGDT